MMKNQVYPQRSNLVSKLSIGLDFKGIYFNAWFEISLAFHILVQQLPRSIPLEANHESGLAALIEIVAHLHIFPFLSLFSISFQMSPLAL